MIKRIQLIILNKSRPAVYYSTINNLETMRYQCARFHVRCDDVTLLGRIAVLRT